METPCKTCVHKHDDRYCYACAKGMVFNYEPKDEAKDNTEED